MEENINKLFENLKTNNNRNKIGVELNLARKFLTNGIYDKTTIIWGCTFTLAMIASFFVSIYALGFFGIFYAIIFCILLSTYMGMCSINLSINSLIFFICICGTARFFCLRYEILYPICI